MRRLTKFASGALAAGVTTWLASPAFGQEEAPTVEGVAEGVTTLGQDVNLLWIVIGAALVIFMQAGFAMVETGFCRAKHAAHVVVTNFAIFALGFVAFFVIGYGLMFGGYSYVLPGFDFGYGSAVAYVLFAVTLLITLGVVLYARRRGMQAF